MSRLRVIHDPPLNGALNMALDETLLDSVCAGQSDFILRFYYWKPACLSLGYNQKSDNINFEKLSESGSELVRRATGGRAVLHENELTYSLILGLSDGKEQSVNASCQKIHEIIAEGIKNIGITAELNKENRRGGKTPICFSSASFSELKVSGQKIVGSAQMRRNGFLLQHGSIPYGNTVGNINHYFNLKEGEHIPDQNTILSSSDIAGLTAEIIRGAEKAFSLSAYISGYTEQEKKHSMILSEEKYKNDIWTFRR